MCIYDGGGQEDRGWHFGLGSALGAGVGPSLSWAGLALLLGGGWPFLLGEGIGQLCVVIIVIIISIML